MCLSPIVPIFQYSNVPSFHPPVVVNPLFQYSTLPLFLVLMNVVFQTRSTSETIRIGERLGTLLLPGDVIALTGELGTGKTHFIKGVAWGAGVSKSSVVSSPSFTLVHEYAGRAPFYHIDLYRLESGEEAEALGLEEVLEGEGIAAIEWADRTPSLLPNEILRIQIHYTGKNTRSIEISAKGDRYKKLMKSLEFGVRSSENHKKNTALLSEEGD